MNSVNVSAKTVDEAIHKALKQLGIRKDNADIEVIHEPSAGLFGLIGSREAEVKVSVKKEPEDFLKDYLFGFFQKMHFTVQINVLNSDPEVITLDIQGEDLGILIGRRGQTLNSLQYLLNVILRRQFQGLQKKVVIDIENYRQRREKTLNQLALSLAKKAVQTKKQIVLEPMAPHERRIIHLTLQNNNEVYTYSKGDEPYRKVVISVK